VENPKLKILERTLNTSGLFNRLLDQIWFFQMRALLHLPFMLHADSDRRYEYKKSSGLDAAREVHLARFIVQLLMKGLKVRPVGITPLTPNSTGTAPHARPRSDREAHDLHRHPSMEECGLQYRIRQICPDKPSWPSQSESPSCGSIKDDSRMRKAIAKEFSTPIPNSIFAFIL
jgi:hypothetical protein